ncbi:transposase [Corynebacterium sp. 320]
MCKIHAGLMILAAVRQVLPAPSWQRCRTHFAKNPSLKVLKYQWTAPSVKIRRWRQQFHIRKTSG